MDSKSLKAKVAIITVLVIGWAVLTFSQSRQDSGPKLPESRLRVDPVDNTITGITAEDLQKMKDEWDATRASLENRINSLESRVSSLETEQNR